MVKCKNFMKLTFPKRLDGLRDGVRNLSERWLVFYTIIGKGKGNFPYDTINNILGRNCKNFIYWYSKTGIRDVFGSGSPPEVIYQIFNFSTPSSKTHSSKCFNHQTFIITNMTKIINQKFQNITQLGTVKYQKLI